MIIKTLILVIKIFKYINQIINANIITLTIFKYLILLSLIHLIEFYMFYTPI
ncbi:hypothetical protein XIS1_400015 [Xenorhabdus innexi]|uniref:Uncharacterized protein n=1 Tax=Xenorhabdus innexi TaxID=290109 RepID=A0A1N6MXP3_9GAMM|nr:hypothetical protein XIS1_400015 [Xenorhabdus innexi]